MTAGLWAGGAVERGAIVVVDEDIWSPTFISRKKGGQCTGKGSMLFAAFIKLMSSGLHSVRTTAKKQHTAVLPSINT